MSIKRSLYKGTLIALILSLPPTVAFSAQKITSGSSCKIYKQKITYKNKSYLCVKSGKKLVWNRDFAIFKPIPTPAPTVIDLSLDSRITPRSNLSESDFCKTNDLSTTSPTNNGFPRPSSALVSPKSVRILVLPINLPDFPFQDSDLESLKRATTQTSAIYKRVSLEKLNLEFIYPEKSEWVTLSRSADSYGIIKNKPQQNNEIVVIDAIAASSERIDFNAYDGVLIETGSFRSTGGGQGFPGQKYSTNHGIAKRVSFEFGTGVGKWETIAHEIGHSLFALEDLYVFLNSSRPTVPDPTPAGSWDMMSSSAPDFFGWSKLLMGFLVDEDFRCITSQADTTHFIANIDSLTGNKLVLIHLSEGHTLALEGRKARDGNQGLLVYEIDSTINHGDGPIKAQKELVETVNSIVVLGFNIEVLDRNKNGLLVRVTK